MSDEGRRVGSLSQVKKINKQGQMFMKTGPTGKQAICLSVDLSIQSGKVKLATPL